METMPGEQVVPLLKTTSAMWAQRNGEDGRRERNDRLGYGAMRSYSKQNLTYESHELNSGVMVVIDSLWKLGEVNEDRIPSVI